MNYYFNNKNNRIGDEVQMTAFLRYFKIKNPDSIIYYQDENRYFSAQKHFPKGLVTFCNSRPEDTEDLHTSNLWISRNLLVSKGIYTEIDQHWKPLTRTDKIAFFPLLSPAYNINRMMSIDMVTEVIKSLGKEHRVWTDVDMNKPNDIEQMDSRGLPYCLSQSIGNIIESVRFSKMVISGDTGVSHIAGAMGHPNIVTIYGNSDHDKHGFYHDQKFFAEKYNEPSLLSDNYVWCSLPCCDPKNLTVIEMVDHKLPPDGIERLLEAVNKC